MDNRTRRLNRYPPKKIQQGVCKPLNRLENLYPLARDGCKFLNLSGESTDSDPVEVAARCKSRLRVPLGVLEHIAISDPNRTVAVVTRRICSQPSRQIPGPRDLSSWSVDISSSMRCSRSPSFWATTRSCRPPIDKTALSTSSECWINATKCAPQGPNCPESQFFTVRSFAPVQPATVLMRVFLSRKVRSNAAEISSAKFIAASTLPPMPAKSTSTQSLP